MDKHKLDNIIITLILAPLVIILAVLLFSKALDIPVFDLLNNSQERVVEVPENHLYVIKDVLTSENIKYKTVKRDDAIRYVDTFFPGENFIHNLDLIDYDTGKNHYSINKSTYFANDVMINDTPNPFDIRNIEAVLNRYSNTLNDSAKYQELLQKVNNLKKTISVLSGKMIFIKDEPLMISWMQTLNPKVRIISNIDAGSEGNQDLNEVFDYAVKKYDAKLFRKHQGDNLHEYLTDLNEQLQKIAK